MSMVAPMTLIAVTALASGFALGRVWEIRQAMHRQAASDSARLPVTPDDRRAALADRLARPR